jgi:hypothetical protein
MNLRDGVKRTLMEILLPVMLTTSCYKNLNGLEENQHYGCDEFVQLYKDACEPRIKDSAFPLSANYWLQECHESLTYASIKEFQDLFGCIRDVCYAADQDDLPRMINNCEFRHFPE